MKRRLKRRGEKRKWSERMRVKGGKLQKKKSEGRKKSGAKVERSERERRRWKRRDFFGSICNPSRVRCVKKRKKERCREMKKEEIERKKDGKRNGSFSRSPFHLLPPSIPILSFSLSPFSHSSPPILISLQASS